MSCSETRRGLAWLLGLAWLCASAAAPAAEAKRSEERRLPARELAQVIVENPVGSIELQGEQREDLALAVQYRVWGLDGAALREAIGGLRIEIVEEDGRLRLRPAGGDRRIDGPRPGYLDGGALSIDLRLRLPAGLPAAASVTSERLLATGLAGDLVLAATSGDIEGRQLGGRLEAVATSGGLRIAGVAGDVALTTTSGDIELREAGGDAVLRTATGQLRIDHLAGAATLETTSGEVVAGDVAGPLELISASGDVAIRRPGGDLKVNCASGDLSVFDLGPRRGGEPREVFLASSSGDVELLVLPGWGFHLEAATDLGAMQLRLPLRVEDLSRRRVTGVCGDGGGRLRVVTATGDIRIAVAKPLKSTD